MFLVLSQCSAHRVFSRQQETIDAAVLCPVLARTHLLPACPHVLLHVSLLTGVSDDLHLLK